MRPRKAMLVATSAIVAFALTSGAPNAWTGAAPSDDHARKRAKSSLLVASPARGFRDAPIRSYSGPEARSASASLAATIPLPDGGNFNGIRFELVEGDLTDLDLDHVLQYNAACQWQRALTDRREVETARLIAHDVPAWSTFRGNERGALMRAALQDHDAGGGSVLAAVLADCAASHERETAYARSLGVRPSA